MGGRDQVVAHLHQSLCEHGNSKGQQSQSNNENCLSHTDQGWLADNGVPGIGIDKQTIEALHDLYKWKSSSLVNRKPDLNSYNRVTNSQDWSSSRTQSPLNNGVAGSS